MAFTVHQSSQQIGRPNAGAAASPVSRDFFLDRSKDNVGKGLQMLGRAVGDFNDAQFAIGLEERREQFNADLIAEVQAYQDRLDGWTSEYRAGHQFGAARDTARDTADWHDKEMGGVLARWQGNPTAERYLTQQLGGIRNSSLSNGRSYQTQQLDLYKNQLYDRNRTEFLIMAEDPKTGDADLLQHMGALSQELDMLYAGGDAQAHKLRLGQDFRAARQKAELESLYLEIEADPYRAREMIGQRMSARTGLGPDAVFAMSFESAGDAAAIGYDGRGGTSYGYYQLSSKQGSMDAFVNWLDGQGESGAAAAARLREAGPFDTGGKAGAAPQVWGELVSEGLISDEMQTEFIRDSHVRPALAGMPQAFRNLVEDSPTVAAAVFSTAVQHGAGGGGKLLERAWNLSGGDSGQFIHQLYELRRGQFGGSDPQTRSAVLARLAEEEGALLAGVVDQYAGSYLSNSQLRQMDSVAQTEISRVESAARQEIQGVLGNMNNEIAYAIASDDYSRLTETWHTAVKHGLTEEAQRIYDVIELEAETQKFLKALPSMTFADMDQALTDLAGPDRGFVRPDNAASALKVVEELQKAVDRHREAFQKDPAGYVLEVNGHLFDGLRDEDGQIRPGAVAEAARINQNQQRELLRGLVADDDLAKVQVRVLSTAQAAGIKETANSRDVPPAQKLSALIGLYDSYGALSNQVFSEAGLGADMLTAVRLAIDAPQERAVAEAMLLAASLSASEVPPSQLSAADISRTVWDSQYINYLNKLQAAVPSVYAFNEQFRKVFDTSERMIKIYGEQALKPLDGAYQYSVSDNMVLALPVSARVPIAYVESGLALVGENLGQYRDYYRGGADWEQLDFSALAQAGTWISVNSGAEYALMVGGQAAFTLPLEQVVAVRNADHEGQRQQVEDMRGGEAARALEQNIQQEEARARLPLTEQEQLLREMEERERAGTGAAEFNPWTGD